MERKGVRSILISIKAFIVGSTMIIPGVSGGTMAMILGEYDSLIGSVPGLLNRRKFKESFIYLAIFCTFALLGIFLASKPLGLLLDKHYEIVMYFFIGAVFGTVPMIVRKAGEAKAKSYLQSIIYVLLGAGAVILISKIPQGAIKPSSSLSISGVLFQLLAGVLISVGLILPGISTSYLLVVLGLYDLILDAIATFDLLPLIPLALGLVLGTFLLTGFLKWAMEKHPYVTYMMILGFLFASIVEVFPGIPSGLDLLISIFSFLLGVYVIYQISKKEI